MASRVGSALSPLLVIPLLHAYGWRATFVVFGFVGIGRAIVFGALMSAYGSCDLPLIPTVVMSAISTVVWLKIAPTEPIDAGQP